MKTFLASFAVFALLAAGAAHAGPLAPPARVVATHDRDFIERSGAQTLQELLDTGIIRYFLTGGQDLFVLVNGRPYSSTGGDLEPLPLSAVERIEVLAGDSLGSIGGATVRGALNIVLRSDLDGFEARTVTRAPSRDGGDAWQGSVFWGGAFGEGRMTLGVDAIDRQEIPGSERVHSRSEWVAGGEFSQMKNVSISGNTAFVVPLVPDPENPGKFVRDKVTIDGKEVDAPKRSVALGDCDTAHGYVPGINPSGITSGDKGCGFAYGDIWWDTRSREQQSAVLNLDHPLGDDADLRLDMNITQYETAFRYAPSVDVFSVSVTDEGGTVTNQALLDAINAAAREADPSLGATDNIADENDGFSIGHRFVGHGNREWADDGEEYDISLGVTGRLAEDLGYDASISTYRWDRLETGVNKVLKRRIRDEIAAGRYNVADPFSQDDDHLAAIEKSRVLETTDSGIETLSTRLALEGSGFAIGGRDAAWTAGVELGRSEAHQLLRFRSNDGMTHRVTDVLGSGGVSYEGKRKTASAFADVSLPVADRLDLRLAGRATEFDDVGGLGSWRAGAEYRPTGIFTLRGSFGAAEGAPSMLHLYSTELQTHPRILCDPGAGPPPRECPKPNVRQVTQELTGNPKLDPVKAERLAFGAEARRGPFFLAAEWYRVSTSKGVGLNSATHAMLNLPECEGEATTNCIERNGGEITIHRGFENVAESEISGINTRFGGGMRTSWGVVGMRGAWRHVLSTDRRVAGAKDRIAITRNAVRVGFLARRGNLSAIWTANYRAGFKNRTLSGEYGSWTGHDLSVDWADPLGLRGARVSAGVFNLTDELLTTDTSDPSATDGPVAAGWGRTFFLTLNARF